MTPFVTIISGPLPRFDPAQAPAPDGAGALVVFDGVVRAEEAGRRIDHLVYDAYEPMAQAMLNRIGEQLIAKHALRGLWVWHARGSVPVGACSFRLVIASAHRKEALAAMDEFIDLLKRDVPIWKRASPEPS